MSLFGEVMNPGTGRNHDVRDLPVKFIKVGAAVVGLLIAAVIFFNYIASDASDGGNVVEEDHRSDQQADYSRANLDELHREITYIMIPASAGIHYFTKERHYILQIFLNATKPPAAVTSNRHTPPRTARSLGKLSRWNAVTMTQYKGSATNREPSTFQNDITILANTC